MTSYYRILGETKILFFIALVFQKKKNIPSNKMNMLESKCSHSKCAKKIQQTWSKYKIHELLKVKELFQDKLTCCVCNEIFTSLFRCSNGHGVCDICYESMQDHSCPLCRNDLSDINEVMVGSLANELNIHVPCGTCDKKFHIKTIEFHRNWCDDYLYMCPSREDCMRRFKSCELMNHLKHHNKNIVFIDNTDNIIFTHISPSENQLIVCFENTKHVVVLRWGGLHSNVGRPLISLNIRCYYPNKESKSISLKMIHHEAIDGTGSSLEEFYLDAIEPITTMKETTSIIPFGVITPHTQLNNDSIFANIQILDNQQKIKEIIKPYCRSLTHYTVNKNSSRRRFSSMIMNQKDIAAFVSMKFSLDTMSISEKYKE
jgi:hypothetical protein